MTHLRTIPHISFSTPHPVANEMYFQPLRLGQRTDHHISNITLVILYPHSPGQTLASPTVAQLTTSTLPHLGADQASEGLRHVLANIPMSWHLPLLVEQLMRERWCSNGLCHSHSSGCVLSWVMPVNCLEVSISKLALEIYFQIGVTAAAVWISAAYTLYCHVILSLVCWVNKDQWVSSFTLLLWPHISRFGLCDVRTYFTFGLVLSSVKMFDV